MQCVTPSLTGFDEYSAVNAIENTVMILYPIAGVQWPIPSTAVSAAIQTVCTSAVLLRCEPKASIMAILSALRTGKPQDIVALSALFRQALSRGAGTLRETGHGIVQLLRAVAHHHKDQRHRAAGS